SGRQTRGQCGKFLPAVSHFRGRWRHAVSRKRPKASPGSGSPSNLPPRCPPVLRLEVVVALFRAPCSLAAVLLWSAPWRQYRCCLLPSTELLRPANFFLLAPP